MNFIIGYSLWMLIVNVNCFLYKQPHVRIWDTMNLNTLHVIGIGDFDKAVSCLSFSKLVRLVVLITGNSVQLYRQNPTTMLIEKLSILITDTGEYFCVSFYMNGISRKWVKGHKFYNIYSIFKRSFMQIILYASLLRLKYDS